MSTSVNPIPEGHHTITPHLVVKNGAQAIEFYKKAFGAEERFRMNTPDGKSIAHAQLKMGDSVFMLAEEFPQMNSLSESIGGSLCTYMLRMSMSSLIRQCLQVLQC